MTMQSDQGHFEEARLRAIARELAMNIVEPATVFKAHSVTQEDWVRMSRLPQFLRMMQEELAIWNSTMSLRERVDTKTLSMVEQVLPQMYRYLHDPKFGDTAKVNLFVALQKGAGIGVKEAVTPGVNPGERVQITINMGLDKQLTIDHEMKQVEQIEG